MPNTNSGDQTITIPLSDYEQLKSDQAFLNALRAAGVDNWDGYDHAIDLIEQDD